MALDVYKALASMKSTLKTNWSNITFDYEIKDAGKGEVAKATAGVNLKGFDDDITIVISAYSGGVVEFRAVFDKIELSEEVLVLVNQFNLGSTVFRAFVREDGYLELSHGFVATGEDELEEYINEMLYSLIDLEEDEIMQTLTAFTE